MALIHPHLTLTLKDKTRKTLTFHKTLHSLDTFHQIWGQAIAPDSQIFSQREGSFKLEGFWSLNLHHSRVSLYSIESEW